MISSRRTAPFSLVGWLALLILLAGCSTVAMDEAERLARAGDYERAYSVLAEARRERPDDTALRSAQERARDRIVVRALSQAELAQASGRLDEVQRLVERVRAIDPQNPRLAQLDAETRRLRAEQQQVRARREAPATPPAPAPREAGAGGGKPVTLEFRDAPLRNVFEALARTTNVNFVFDKDVKSDARITVFLRNVTLDEGLRVILATQQLDRKLLNDSTLLIYPNTPAKQREHQELVTRSLYLANADVKQAAAMVRTLAKTRDLHVDERLNALVVRDTPEVVALVERMLATIDLPEPEVTLAIEVLEIASDRSDELGLSWPTEVQYGLANSAAQLVLGASGLRGFVANPAVVAALKGGGGSANLLANPTIRARNREKAKVQIGEKLPVFSTTSATVNVGASTTVALIDVGLKLDIEPTVQLDGDVSIKLALEVSNLVRQIEGPNGSLAYQLGNRLTSTSLRLRDGETQVLAGLINDEDRRSASGLPYLATLPVIGRLFGVQKDSRAKTEIVMLITPRIVRNLVVPSNAEATMASGTDALPGAEPLRLRARATAGVGPSGAGSNAASPAQPADARQAGTTAGGDGEGALVLSVTAEAAVGETVSITLANRSASAVKGELEVDPAALRPASAGLTLTGARVPFAIEPRQETVLVFRVLPGAAGSELRAFVASATTASGGLAVEGSGQTRIKPRAAP